MSSPDLDEKVTDFYSGAFIDYPTVCLKKIPFEAIKNVILGFSISIDDEQKIIQDISNNPELSHVKLKRAMHDVFGEITLKDI